MIRVLIVDDHTLVRMGVRRLLKDVQDIEVIGEAGSGEKAIQLMSELQPHVILMDICMPGIGGVKTIEKILKKHPDVKIITLTRYSSDSFFLSLLEMGVLGYLTKDAAKSEMIEAIYKAHSGQRYINDNLSRRFVLKRLKKGKEARFDILSKRELEIATLIINGYDVQTIASDLKLNSKTVNSYRYRIFEKLKVTHDVSLILLALQEGLLTLSDKQGASEGSVA